MPLHTVLSLMLVSIVLVGLTSQHVRRFFDRCCWPVFREPTQDIPTSVFAVMSCAFAVCCFYSIAAGVVTMFVRGQAPSAESLQVGAATGAFAFGCARLFALTESQRLARNVYTNTIMGFGAFLSVGLVTDGSWTRLADDVVKLGSDDLRILPFMVQMILGTVLVPEGIVALQERLFGERGHVGFSLLREQTESFEKYRVLRGDTEIVSAMREEALKAVRAAGGGGRVEICWLSANGSPKILEALEAADQLAKQSGVQLTLRVVAHSSAASRANLTQALACRYVEHAGHLRLFIVGGRVAILGVQLGAERQHWFPDYAVKVDNPVRIGWCMNHFESFWRQDGSNP